MKPLEALPAVPDNGVGDFPSHHFQTFWREQYRLGQHGGGPRAPRATQVKTGKGAEHLTTRSTSTQGAVSSTTYDAFMGCPFCL